MNEWGFDPKTGCDGVSQGLLGWEILGLPMLWARERSPEVGGPGVGWDGESDTWDWQTQGMGSLCDA